jgi:hypothetical protein
LIRQGKHAEAVPILRACLEIKEKTDPGDWATANARSLLGEALIGQREFPAAEPLLLDAHKALTERRDKIRPLDREAILRDAIDRLVRLYEARGKPERPRPGGRSSARVRWTAASRPTRSCRDRTPESRDTSVAAKAGNC